MQITFKMHKCELRIRRFMASSRGQIINKFLHYLPYLLVIVALKTVLILMVINSFPGETNHANFNDYGVDKEIVEKKSLWREDPDPGPDWRKKLKEVGTFDFLQTILAPTHTNRTPTNTTWLFFNRIPRTGGQTIVSLLHALGKDLDYTHKEHEYRSPWQRLLAEEEQKNLMTWFENNFWTKSYDRFALYINFTKYKSKYTETSPAYFTMVRDPIQKFISNFHYKRKDREKSKIEMSIREQQKPGSGRRWYLRTIDECVLEKDEECDFKSNKTLNDFVSAIPFLCGQQKDCLIFDSKWALQMAKYHAEYEYSVVGLIENMNSTLAVLDKYLPLFFTGAFEKYWSEGFTKRSENTNPKSVKSPSKEVMQILKDKFALELELYEFLRQRLAGQHSLIIHHSKFKPPIQQRTRPPELRNIIERFQVQMQDIEERLKRSKVVLKGKTQSIQNLAMRNVHP